MGIVKREAALSSIFSYTGIALGYINVILLFPFILTAEQFGLTRLLLSISAFYTQIASLGTERAIVRFMPYFKDPPEKKQSFVLLIICLVFIGFIIVTAAFLLLKPILLNNFEEKPNLLNAYYHLAILLSFFLLLFQVSAAFLQANLQSSFILFLKDVVLRIIFTIALLLVYFELINFHAFIYLFILAYGLILIIAFFAVWKTMPPLFHKIRYYFKKRLVKIIINYGLYSILTNLSKNLIFRIDILMVGFLLGLEEAAVYSLVVYLFSVMEVPSKSIIRIANPLIALNLKQKEYQEIQAIYYKSSLISLLIGGLIFIGILANNHNIYYLLPDNYNAGIQILIILGLGKLIDMSTGSNGAIINNSTYYRVDTSLAVILAIITVGSNLIFIPLLGLSGAALATAISLLLYNGFKVWFVYIKFSLLPFSLKTLGALFIIIFTYISSEIIPPLNNVFLDILVRSGFIIGIFSLLITNFKISEDINTTIYNVYQKAVKISKIKK